MAVESQIVVRSTREAVFNTIPTGTGVVWKTVRRAGKLDFSYKAKTKRSEEVRPDRGEGDLKLVGAEIGAGFNGELSPGTWDEYWEALFGSAWSTTNILKVGNLLYSYAFELVHQDLPAPNREWYAGCVIDSAKITITAEDIIKVEFRFKGASSSGGLVSTVTATTATAATNTEVMTATSDYVAKAKLLINGAVLAACIDELTFEFSNNLDVGKCIAAMGASSIDMDKFTVKVGAKIALNAASVPIYNQAVAAKVPLSISVDAKTAAGKGYTFLAPRIFAPDTAKAGDKTLNIDLKGECSTDPTLLTPFQITRVP